MNGRVYARGRCGVRAGRWWKARAGGMLGIQRKCAETQCGLPEMSGSENMVMIAARRGRRAGMRPFATRRQILAPRLSRARPAARLPSPRDGAPHARAVYVARSSSEIEVDK